MPTEYQANDRYFSILGTGEDEEGGSSVIVAIKDVPRYPNDASVVTVVKNDKEDETLRRIKRGREFAEEQARLALTGLPVDSTKQPEAARDCDEDLAKKVQTATRRGPPSRGSIVRASAAASGTSRFPTTTDDETHPEGSRTEASGYYKPASRPARQQALHARYSRPGIHNQSTKPPTPTSSLNQHEPAVRDGARVVDGQLSSSEPWHPPVPPAG